MVPERSTGIGQDYFPAAKNGPLDVHPAHDGS
jgi:hypothetical protein